MTPYLKPGHNAWISNMPNFNGLCLPCTFLVSLFFTVVKRYRETAPAMRWPRNQYSRTVHSLRNWRHTGVPSLSGCVLACTFCINKSELHRGVNTSHANSADSVKLWKECCLQLVACLCGVMLVHAHALFMYVTSSTAQGGGGSFKNRKTIGEVRCCESRMAKRVHWWTERWLELCFFEWLQWL